MPKSEAEAPVFVSARDVVRMLHVRFPAPEWGLVEQVSANSGRRYADCVAMNLWPSRGLEVHGFEVKVSRADWRVELRKPAKAEESVFRFCDRWWLVAPRGAVKREELPTPWGLLEVVGERLVQAVEAPKLQPTEPSKLLLASVWRRVLTWREEHVHKGDVSTEVERRVAEQLEAEVRRRLGRVDDAGEQLARLRQRIQDFEEAAGVSLDDWLGRKYPKALGQAAHELVTRRRDILSHLEGLVRIAAELQREVAALPPTADVEA